MTRQIRAYAGCVALTTRIERAVMITHVCFGLLSLGVSEQHQAHGTKIDFCCRAD